MRNNSIEPAPAFNFAFGFGNVRIWAFENEASSKSTFFAGMSGTYLLKVKDEAAFAGRFGGRKRRLSEKVRSETVAIVRKLGEEALMDYSESFDIYRQYTRKHISALQDIICEKLQKSPDFSAMGLHVVSVSIDNIIMCGCDEPANYRLRGDVRPRGTYSAAKLIAVAAFSFVMCAGVFFFINNLLPKRQPDTPTVTLQTTVSDTTAQSSTSSSDTTSSENSVASTSETTATTATTTETTATTTTVTETTATIRPPQNHTDGDVFDYGDFTVRVVGSRCIIEKYNGSETNVYIPDKIDGLTVYRIEYNAFQNNFTLESVRFPSSLKEIGGSSFNNCTSLSSVTFPYGLERIEAGAFSYCTSLTEISLPDTVKVFDGYVFQHCLSLKSAKLAGSFSEMNSTFAYCTSLENVTIPDSVKIISGSCFRACKDIKEIRLPEGLKMIKETGFWECDGLVTVYIPKNIVVDDDAFLGCHDTVFYVYADELPAGWGKSWEQADFSAKTIKEAP